MRDWILKIHLYGGLLCSGYLIILAVSSLNYNHKFGEPGTEKVTWERALRIEDGEKNQAVAERVRDELGLMGWIISWEVRREENGNLRFGIARPGKRYRIRVLFDQDRITVEETRSGFWQVINNLHALTRLPGSAFVTTWGILVEVSVWMVLFSAVSGVYLWATLKRERVIGMVILGSGFVFSLVFMLYVWWRG